MTNPSRIIQERQEKAKEGNKVNEALSYEQKDCPFVLLDMYICCKDISSSCELRFDAV